MKIESISTPEYFINEILVPDMDNSKWTASAAFHYI